MKPEHVPPQLVELALQAGYTAEQARGLLSATLPRAQWMVLNMVADDMSQIYQRPNGPADVVRSFADHMLECRCPEQAQGT